jgi:EAL domain-containing protein (putative c-di-GMP-specific phosphodiesterase class I)
MKSTNGDHGRPESGKDLVRAITNGELELRYQPILDLTNRYLTGFEALLRWRHPSKGLVGPNRIIPLAEECGLIQEIDDWVLREAAERLAAWQDDVLVVDGFRVHVNVSGMELDDRTLVERVRRCVAETQVIPSGLTIEVTETRLIDDIASAKRAIDGLHDMGVELALDDFGTEYATFMRLHALRFDIVKIDKGFVAACDTDLGRAFIRAFVDLANGLGAGIIAEGIETTDQLDKVMDAGCHQGQGFLWSPAIPVADAEHLLLTGELPAEDPVTKQRTRLPSAS